MMKKIIFIGLLLVPAAGWAVYKPMRVLAPYWNGVVCASEQVCVEDIQRVSEATRLYLSSLDFINRSVGIIEDNPRITFCSTEKCFRAFGIRSPAKAMAIGVSGIVIGPSGWSENILRHELIHHIQAERMGVIGQWRSPLWIKEGMAYSLSGDSRILNERWESYRAKFDMWYQQVGREQLWQEAEKL